MPTATEEQEVMQTPSTANLSFRTKKFVLQSLLEKASSVLPTKDILPVLKNFQVEVANNSLRAIATDLELSIIASAEMVTVTSEGIAVFPGKTFIDLIREASDGEIVVDVVDGHANISVGRASWELMLMDGSEYPPIPDTSTIDLHEINREAFLHAISAVRYAASTDTVRPTLMMIDISEGKVRAADGIRFQQVELDNFPIDMQIPIGAVEDLIKLLRSTERTTVAVGESDNHIIFQVAADVFIANKLIADFPDVESLLLKPALGNDQVLHVDRAELISAIKRVRITADPTTSAVTMSLSDGVMKVHSRDKYGNAATETLDVGWTLGDREISVNHVHFLEMLTMTDVKSCSFYFGKDTKTRKSPLMLKDEETHTVGILNQLRDDYLD